MDGLLVLIGVAGLLARLGHLAAAFGADSRAGLGDDLGRELDPDEPRSRAMFRDRCHGPVGW